MFVQPTNILLYVIKETQSSYMPPKSSLNHSQTAVIVFSVNSLFPPPRLTFPPCPLISVPTTLEALTNFWGRKHGSQIRSIVLPLTSVLSTRMWRKVLFFINMILLQKFLYETIGNVRKCCSTWVAKHKHVQLLSIVHEKRTTSWFTTRSIFPITRWTKFLP